MFHRSFSHKCKNHHPAPRRLFAALLFAALLTAAPLTAQAAHSLPDSAFTRIPVGPGKHPRAPGK